MTTLPADWRLLRLDELLAAPLANGRSVKDRPGGFPVLRLTAIRGSRVDLMQSKAGDWTAEEARQYIVKDGDLLVVRGNGSLPLVGRAGIVGPVTSPVAYPDTLIRVRTKEDVVSTQYLALAWKSPALRSQIENAARTTAGIYKINQRDLSALRIPIPPLDEQRRIVDILEDHLSRLDAADATIVRSLRRLDLLDEQTVVRELLDVANEDVGTALARVVAGDLPKLAEEWEWRPLGSVAEVVGGVTKDAKRQGDPSFVEVPYLRVANVQRARLSLESVTTIRVSQQKAAQLRLEPGDVLMNEGGDRDKLARGWIWSGEIDDCIHQNHVFRARPNRDVVHPEWLAWSANTYGARWAQRHGKQSVNLASISLSTIRKMPIPLPSLERQTAGLARIAHVLDGAKAMRAALRINVQRSSSLRRALLVAAFSGRLTGRESDLDLAEELVG
ncbi:restriction endonuclease subunit S [Cellulomonas timonensis]|uniref:restriction endonuclease subunit S n=1 Tax=Cellulomonas timonensis TaxID=1689271 RepID=UPI00083503E2|nr:restriction endonuclease subunit S [Cellulomonas timonensis]